MFGNIRYQQYFTVNCSRSAYSKNSIIKELPVNQWQQKVTLSNVSTDLFWYFYYNRGTSKSTITESNSVLCTYRPILMILIIELPVNQRQQKITLSYVPIGLFWYFYYNRVTSKSTTTESNSIVWTYRSTIRFWWFHGTLYR